MFTVVILLIHHNFCQLPIVQEGNVDIIFLYLKFLYTIYWTEFPANILIPLNVLWLFSCIVYVI